MSKKILCVFDSHGHPEYNNKRFDYLAPLIIDEQPDIVVHGGDGADMPSLASYDKGKRSFVGRSYAKDVNSFLDGQERMWYPVKKRKKKMPKRVYLIGNHEQRIDRVLDLSPELIGTVGYENLCLKDYYDEVVPYEGNTPGIIDIEGIAFSHFFVSGVMGRSISGEHQAHSMLSKNFKSCVQGHTHTWSNDMRTTVDGKQIQAVVAGCYQDYDAEWAGTVNRLWWRGCVILDNVEDGVFDLRQISLRSLEKAYG